MSLKLTFFTIPGDATFGRLVVIWECMGTLMVAEIVQRLSGLRISDFLQTEIFDPLGLKSTSLGLRKLDPARIVPFRAQNVQPA